MVYKTRFLTPLFIPAYINILKALQQASYRVQGLRRTWLTSWQAAALFNISITDFPTYQPTGVEDTMNYEWAQKLSNGPCLVLALQRHGACYLVWLGLLGSKFLDENFRQIGFLVKFAKN